MNGINADPVGDRVIRTRLNAINPDYMGNRV